MEKEIENILENVLQEAHEETQREIRAKKMKSKIINPEFEVQPITDTPFTLIKGKKTLLTIGNEILMELEKEKINEKGTYKIKYDDNTKNTIFKLNWNLIGPVIYKVATAAAEKVYNELKIK